MSWFTVSWAILLSGVLGATASGAIGMNYRKNGVFNAGLAGIFYFGKYPSHILVSILQMNPYWSIPFSLVFGAMFNLAFNVGILQMLKRGYSRRKISLITSFFVLIGYLAGKGLRWLFRNLYGGQIPHLHFLDHDFILFRTPGILIISVSLMIFSLALQFILNPVIEDRKDNKFDGWEIFIYTLAGATACVAGSLHSFAFSATRSDILLIVAGALLGGVDKKLNPYIGGFVVSFLKIWLTIKSMEIIGQWAGEYSIMILVALILFSVLLYPIGIVGRFRKKVEYKY